MLKIGNKVYYVKVDGLNVAPAQDEVSLIYVSPDNRIFYGLKQVLADALCHVVDDADPKASMLNTPFYVFTENQLYLTLPEVTEAAVIEVQRQAALLIAKLRTPEVDTKKSDDKKTPNKRLYTKEGLLQKVSESKTFMNHPVYAVELPSNDVGNIGTFAYFGKDLSAAVAFREERRVTVPCMLHSHKPGDPLDVWGEVQ